ncbi:uncharacterized protein PV06_03998 [Exophiala oligosperma]|uniref:Small ribosomal subunit protein uS7m n=2 Tax=Chaetothyriales TaxID=34395 RepID=A0A0D2B0K7_9EURO|nr:uncharacterized protein PV06_03998 [Exophiala oligosperma]KAJ9631205.1 hypothetical protein H2204_008290 [Knufia peltigerae]KIW45621.1 hypothetical protein PV06_03998 [Exophiala oligosperma]
MPPRLHLFTSRSVTLRPKTSAPPKSFARAALQRRTASDDASKKPATTPVGPDTQGPTVDQLPHVTEEQAALDKSMGENPPDIEQGTPVQEILKRDKDAQEKAPKVLKDDLKRTSPPGTRSYSTAVERPLPSQHNPRVEFRDMQVVGLDYPDAGFGHKFVLPDIQAMTKLDNFRKRYDPVVDQVTKSIMRHGKLSKAQSNMTTILDILRTAPVPSAAGNEQSSTGTERSLVSTVPREALPLEPIKYLTAAIDSVAPLIKIRQQKGIMGGGASLPLPVPLGLRQRRRTAIQWILSAAESRRELTLAERVAKEIINVAEGRSSAWEKRQRVHRLAISARANIRIAAGGRRIKKKAGSR